MNIEYKIIDKTEKNIFLLEQIRLNAYQIDTSNFNIQNGFYAKDLVNHNYLVIGCFIENELIGAAYIKDTYQSLYIDQIFIRKEYQKAPQHFGTNLLKYILENKDIVEKYFHTSFTYSYLDDGRNTKKFYENLGYTETNNLMRKHL